MFWSFHFFVDASVAVALRFVQVQILRHQNPKCDYYFYFIIVNGKRWTEEEKKIGEMGRKKRDRNEEKSCDEQ